MRARSREINIFSMAALDLFASALGAFILVAVVLFPYFPNTGDSPERLAEIRAQSEEIQNRLRASQAHLGVCETQKQEVQSALDACEERRGAAEGSERALSACQSRNQQLETNLETCRVQARKKFLLILMSWGSTDDIDLHVVDPAGREFYYQVKSFSGSRAKLEEDNIRGPGNEIWLHPAAESGTYKVYYNYYRRSSHGGVRVRGAVLTPDGRTSFPDKILRRRGQKPLIAIITVDAEGDMRVSMM